MRSMFQQKVFTGIALAGLFVSPIVVNAAPSKTSVRPFLGLAAEAMAKDAASNGITVHSVAPDGPAGKAGLKSSDRIVMADGKEVKTFEALKKVLADHKPGDKVALKVLRDGKEQTITVTLGEAPKAREEAAAPAGKHRVYLGIYSQALTTELKDHLGVKVDKGVIVTHVMPESPAAKAGLEEEDVITHVGNVAVTSPEMLRSEVQKAGAGKELALKVSRGAKTMDLKVQLQEAPAGFAGAPHFGMPEGTNDLPEHFRSFFSGVEKFQSVEKKLRDLENRVRELEQTSSK